MEKIDFRAFWLSLQSETLTQLCLGRRDGVQWGVRSAHFKLVSNNMQLLIPNTALCCVFLFVVAPFHSLNPCKTPAVAAINELFSAPQCCCGLGEFADYPVHKGCRRRMGFETWEAFVSGRDNHSSNLGITFIQQRLAGLFFATSTVIVIFTSVASSNVLLYIPAPGYWKQQGHAPVIKQRRVVIALQIAPSKQKGELENSW